MACGDWCVQKIYSLTDLFYLFFYLVQGYADNRRLIDNDRSLVKKTLWMTKNNCFL